MYLYPCFLFKHHPGLSHTDKTKKERNNKNNRNPTTNQDSLYIPYPPKSVNVKRLVNCLILLADEQGSK